METVVGQILRLIEKGTIEQRCAAVLVLSALKLQAPEVVKAVSRILEHPNPVLKDFALRYFEEVQADAAVPSLVHLLDDKDKEIQDRAVRVLSRWGRPAVGSLLELAPTATRLWQVNAARVLCSLRLNSAYKGLLQMLMSGTDEFNKAVCDLVIGMIREMKPNEQEEFSTDLEAFVAKLDVSGHRPAVISALRLVGQLGRPQARRWLFKLIGPENHPNIRTHALVACLRSLREQDLRKDEHARLISLLEEPEFTEAARLALELLDAHALPDDARPLLSRLMQSHHEAVQKFALRKMGDFGTPATVRTLIEQLGDPDYRRREVAARSLHKIPEARSALTKELLVTRDPSKAWSIAELLPSYEGKWRPDALQALWKRLQSAIQSEDRIQTAFLHVLKGASVGNTYAQLASHAAKLIKAKKYKEALPFLALLKDFPEFKPEDKFLFALAQVKSHARIVATPRQHAAIELLADLYRRSAFPLLETIKRDRHLTPDELFYLGFTFSERPGEERHLGRDLLEHVAAKFPRTKLGKSSRNKLKLLRW